MASPPWLTKGRGLGHPPADVLGVEHLAADAAPEAAQVPVLVQGHQGLLLAELLPTAAAA